MMEFYQTILILCSLLIISVESLMFHLEANARFEFIDLHEVSPVNENVQEVSGDIYVVEWRALCSCKFQEVVDIAHKFSLPCFTVDNLLSLG